jgi:glycosyltransferase involved in cell wall biosynthesis
MQDISIKNQEVNGEKVEGGRMEKWKLEADANKIKISFIANLEYRKGLDIFLKGIYAYEYPVFLEVHLIGRIREEWVATHLPKSMLNHNVKLVYQPAMSQADLFKYLQQEQFDLNVQTSRFDSFAMVVPETMMQGIPNVVSPFVGAGEMIRDGIDGFIMDQLDSKSLSIILKNYIQLNQQERNKLKLRVLASSKNMVWENYYSNLGKVFEEILADKQ